MEISQFFKSVIDMDTSAVVICDKAHNIVYMNPAAAERYKKYGGAALTGRSLMACHNPRSREAIENVLAWFESGTEHNVVHTYYNEKENKDVYMVALRAESGALIGYYEKHEYRTRDDSPLYKLDQ